MATNQILTKQSSDNEIRSYFNAILELSKSDKEFPVNLDEVWMLVYNRKEEAVRSLTTSDLFIQGVDYQILRRNAENSKRGRPASDYYLTVPCLEFFIARKVRAVFEIYRQVFHYQISKSFSTGTTQTDYTCTENTHGSVDNLSGLLTEIEEELSESISMLQHKKDRISYLKYRLEREETLSAGTAQSQFEQRISRLEQMIQNYLSGDNGSVTPVNKNPETTTHPFYAKKDIPCYTVSEIRTRFRDAMLVRQMARTMSRENGIVVRTARLFDFLRREGWLLSTPECYNAPSEESTKRGLILAAHSSATGSGVKYYTPYITREGYEFFSRIIMQKGGYL